MARPKKNPDTVTSPTTGAERSIIRALKDITRSDAETYYIIWKYAPDLLPADKNIKSYADLAANYRDFDGRTEESFEKALLKEDVQAGVRYLLKKLEFRRDLDLLNKYYDLSMNGDTQALKAYIAFRKTFFADAEADELKSILNGVSFSNKDDTEFDMNF